MTIRIVVAAAAAAAIVTAAQSQAPTQGAPPGVGVLRVEPDVVPPLRSFTIKPEAAPVAPAARPPADDASLTLSRRPAVETEPHEQGATGQRHHRGSVELQAPARRSRHTRYREAAAPDRGAVQATNNAVQAPPALSRAQREAIVRAILQDGKGIVPATSAPFLAYPVGAQVAQFSLMISPLPAGAVARAPQLGAYGYLVIRDRVLLVDPRTVTVVADLAG
jgi:hypothetical protein